MKKIILIITILFLSCQKKDTTVSKTITKAQQEKGEYFSAYTKKESSVLEYRTDTLSLFYNKNNLNRVEIKSLNESFGGDTPSGYQRDGYHINAENFLDGIISITDTLSGDNVSDYPIRYEERYEFYKKKYTFSYISFDGKKISNYFKSNENPSKGYFKDLLSLDVALSKVNFPLQKMPKALYNIKKNTDELYAGQDSIKVYEIGNINSYKMISSSIPFKYFRDIIIKKENTIFKYLAKISLKNEGFKYIDLKEIKRVQVTNPYLDGERFVTASKGLELYDNSQSSDFFGKKEFLIAKIPKGERVDVKDDFGNYIYIDGKKGKLVNVTYYDKNGDSKQGIVFSGYLSINKP